MMVLNNLKGHIVKNCKIIYKERIENNLYFIIILMYEPKFDGKWDQNSSQLICEAGMTTGSTYSWGNGIISLDGASMIEVVEVNDNFTPLREELKTKDGFRVWQKEYSCGEYEDVWKGKQTNLKIRRVSWLVEVPELDLLRYCLKDK